MSYGLLSHLAMLLFVFAVGRQPDRQPTHTGTCNVQGIKGRGRAVHSWQKFQSLLNSFFSTRSSLFLYSHTLFYRHPMAQSALPEFQVHPYTSQTFFREPAGPTWTQWRPLPPSDHHPPRPSSHDVSARLALMHNAVLLIINSSSLLAQITWLRSLSMVVPRFRLPCPPLLPRLNPSTNTP